MKRAGRREVVGDEVTVGNGRPHSALELHNQLHHAHAVDEPDGEQLGVGLDRRRSLAAGALHERVDTRYHLLEPGPHVLAPLAARYASRAATSPTGPNAR